MPCASEACSRATPSTVYSSYASDILVPFGAYFLLVPLAFSVPVLRPWAVKSLMVFGIASGTEIAQAFGLPLLGRTFDPVDVLLFGAGVPFAALVDHQLLGRYVAPWRAAFPRSA